MSFNSIITFGTILDIIRYGHVRSGNQDILSVGKLSELRIGYIRRQPFDLVRFGQWMAKGDS